MKPHHILLVAAALTATAPSAGAAENPALAKFSEAWSKVEAYTVTIKTHEVQGTSTQDRTYHYAFKKPHFARIDIVGGPGKGGGAVWAGGDKVKGHQGGLLSGIKLTVGIADGRATSLRGDTMDTASFAYILEHFSNTKGGLSEAAGPALDGMPTEEVTLKLADPAANKNVTRESIALSSVSHLPLRRMRYEGETLVKQEDFSDVKLNPPLKDSDFSV